MAHISNLAASEQVFTSNVFLVDGDRTVLVDPGNEFDVVSKIESRTGGLDAVVLTHTHHDHIGNTGAVTEAFDVDVWGFDPDTMYTVYEIARLLQGVEVDRELDAATEGVFLDWAIPWMLDNQAAFCFAEPDDDASPGFYGLRD